MTSWWNVRHSRAMASAARTLFNLPTLTWPRPVRKAIDEVADTLMMLTGMTLVEIGRKQLWPLSAILGAGGLAMVLLDVFAVRGLSLFSMLAVLCWMGAVIPLVEHRRPTPVVRADEDGIRFWANPATPWTEVRAVVLFEQENDDDVGQYLVLASSVPLTGGDLDEDPKVVTWLALPGAVDRVDADRIGAQLRTFQPDLKVVDLGRSEQ